MHSIAIVSLLAAAAGFVSAAPAQGNAPRSAFYVCGNSGFRGDCSVDPCALSWCPDYEPGTLIPVGTGGGADNTPVTPPTTPPAGTGTGSADPSICPVGTGYFQVCAGSGFRGCCKSDACGQTWCPDYKPWTYEPKHTWEVRRAAAPVGAAWSDPTVCAPGTGFYQVCANNGFKGCCKGDACGQAWCPDYKLGTYEPVSPKPADAPKPAGQTTTTTTTTTNTNNGGWTDPTVCKPNTGYYQVCASGFKGCCKADACSLGYCPN